MNRTNEDQDPIEFIKLEPLIRLGDSLQTLLRDRLWAKVLVGLVFGILVGLLMGPEAGWLPPDLSRTLAQWLALPGTLFLAVVQMIVIPLVVASIVRGLGESDNITQLRSLGLRAAAYFLGTTVIALAIGLGTALLIKPGSRLRIRSNAPSGSSELDSATASSVDQEKIIPEAIVDLIPNNPLASMVDGEVLQIVVLALVIGIALVSMPVDKSKPLFDLLGAVQDVCMKVVQWAMKIAPLAVFGLIARVVSQLGFDALTGLGAYVMTVIAALLLQCFVYFALLWFVGGIKPLHFLAVARQVQLLAFSTSSSAAVMPMSIKTAEKELNVRAGTARFLIPLGATINMDGTAVYQGVATVFLAQAFGLELDTGALLLIAVTAVAASIGAPAAPGVGIVVLAAVLNSVGIPLEGITLILGVDRILDMVRTAVNVTGDLTATVVLDRWTGGRKSENAAPQAQ